MLTTFGAILGDRISFFYLNFWIQSRIHQKKQVWKEKKLSAFCFGYGKVEQMKVCHLCSAELQSWGKDTKFLRIVISPPLHGRQPLKSHSEKQQPTKKQTGISKTWNCKLKKPVTSSGKRIIPSTSRISNSTGNLAFLQRLFPLFFYKDRPQPAVSQELLRYFR